MKHQQITKWIVKLCIVLALCMCCVLTQAANCFNDIHYQCADWGPDLDATDPDKADEVIYFIKKIDFSCDGPSALNGPGQRLWLCKMNWDGTHKKEICELWTGQNPGVATGGDNMWLSVCAKARKAVLSVEYGMGMPFGVWQIDLDGKNLRQLMSLKIEPGNVLAYVHPSLRPDGEEVVFNTVQHDPEAEVGRSVAPGEVPRQLSRLEILNITTGRVRRLTNSVRDDQPSWSPNGDWIVFTHYKEYSGSKADRKIWLIKPDGSENKPIMGGFSAQRMAINDKEALFAWYPAWSHDGKWIYALDGNPFFSVADAGAGKTILYKRATINRKDCSVFRAQVGKRGFVFSGLSVWVIVAAPPKFDITEVIDRCQSARVPSQHYGDLSTYDLRWGESPNSFTNGDPRVSVAYDMQERLWEFSVGDITNLPAFTNKLKHGADPISQYLVSRLSFRGQRVVSMYPGIGFRSDQEVILVEDLNEIVSGSSIYATNRFAGVELRTETRELLSRNPQGVEVFRLNRLLLEDSYPLEMSSKPKAGEPQK